MDKKNKNPNVPNLRFNQFNSEWERKSIGDLINEVKEYTSSFEKYPLYSFTIESGVTPKTERYERNFLVKKDGDLFKVVHPNNFVMNPMNLRFGAINYSKQTIDVSVSGYYDIFEIDNSNYNDFWNAYFKAPQTINTYNSIATGSLIEKKRVHFSQLKSLKFYLPSNDEKEKINSFIKLLDDRISVQIKIIEEYVILKNSLIHRFFTMDNPKVKLSTILTEINIKNKNKQIDTVLSVSNKLGFIKQSEQFEDREVASDDTSNYKIVNKGDYAYNPARINVGSIARLINYDKGIISPMYSCFKINEKKITYTYFDMFLSSFSFKRQLNKKLEGSVRQCLTFEGMLSMDIELPCIETQKSISNKIDMLNYKIKLESDYREALIKQKQFLLNNMFI